MLHASKVRILRKLLRILIGFSYVSGLYGQQRESNVTKNCDKITTDWYVQNDFGEVKPVPFTGSPNDMHVWVAGFEHVWVPN